MKEEEQVTLLSMHYMDMFIFILLLTRKRDLLFPSAKEDPFLFIRIDLGFFKHVAFRILLTVSGTTLW